jgi:hypothetical protein
LLATCVPSAARLKASPIRGTDTIRPETKKMPENRSPGAAVASWVGARPASAEREATPTRCEDEEARHRDLQAAPSTEASSMGEFLDLGLITNRAQRERRRRAWRVRVPVYRGLYRLGMIAPIPLACWPGISTEWTPKIVAAWFLLGCAGSPVFDAWLSALARAEGVEIDPDSL